ncbi:MAG: hypothetical protein V7L23_05710 [Nostoc sp.]|uniref:hypothetical protein n=1 Tax=Nostoc sp. TaxID=1180 RepID=UPI002FEE9A23
MGSRGAEEQRSRGAGGSYSKSFPSAPHPLCPSVSCAPCPMPHAQCPILNNLWYSPISPNFLS